MKKCFAMIILIFMLVACITSKYRCVYASPLNALNENKLAEEILIKLQNTDKNEMETQDIYSYLEALYNENTLFYSYKIKELENILQNYQENILKQAKKIAQEKDYKKAVELLQSKICLFKDKSTVTSLINYYSKFFVRDGLFYFEGEPTILSFGKLIAYPEQAFLETSNFKFQNNLTVSEFQNLLKQLYNENYVLVNLSDFINFDEDKPTRKDLYIPQNKIPLLLVFNDTNYDGSVGFIEKYIIDPQGEVACYNSKESEKNLVTYNSDFIPILESFISQNKDFSFNNARAIICLNENDKILGYNISKQNLNQAQDTLSLKKLATLLKEKGYNFAYNGEIANLSQEELDLKKSTIQDTIKQIFGPISMYYCEKSPSSSIKNSILNDFEFKILLDTIKTNNTIFRNNQVIVPVFNITIKDLESKTCPIKELDFNELFDHINRKTN